MQCCKLYIVSNCTIAFVLCDRYILYYTTCLNSNMIYIYIIYAILQWISVVSLYAHCTVYTYWAPPFPDFQTLTAVLE